MLTLNDGRSELWQWDTGRKLTVDADCSQVHFSNKVFGRSIDVDVMDGLAIIPDILLQTDKELTAWAFVGTPENGYTKISKTFKVNRRNKPADYVFTPPEQTTLGELVERLQKIEETQDPDAIKNAVEDYLKENPFEAPVKSVNGKTGKIELSAEDVGAISQDDLQNATNKALEQAKESGEFNGKPGMPGKPGDDGITPHIGDNGNWWIGETDTGVKAQGPQGERGLTGETGPQGEKGQKGDTGAPGADGAKGDKGDTGPAGADGAKGDKGDKGDTGATGPQGEKGATGATGPQGPKGDKGDTGATGPAGAPGATGKDGYTPVRGTDYWTPTDKAEIDAHIADELAKRAQLRPEPAESLEWLKANGDTSKIYVLPDGYLYMWLPKETAGSSVPNFTNLMDDPNAYIKEKSRYSHSGQSWKWYTSDNTENGTPRGDSLVFPFKHPGGTSIIRIRGASDEAGYDYIYTGENNQAFTNALNGVSCTTDANGDIVYTVNYSSALNHYATLVVAPIADKSKVIVTLNEEITYTTTEGGTEYQWVNTGRALVPADYEDRIVTLESDLAVAKEDIETLRGEIGGVSIGANATTAFSTPAYCPTPQQPADGTADFHGLNVTTAQAYDYMDALAAKHKGYVTKQTMGKDQSGAYDHNRYILCKAYWRAWLKPNYPMMFAWKNGNTTVYSVSVSPRVGDTMYTTPYVGTAYSTVTAVNPSAPDAANGIPGTPSTRTVNGLVFDRYPAGDVEPTVVYTKVAGNLTELNGGTVYNSAFGSHTKVTAYTKEAITCADGIVYTRYPFADLKADKTKPLSVFVLANEHGHWGDNKVPSITLMRMAKDLCENRENPFLQWLKENAMLTLIPVGNPWGYDPSAGDNGAGYNNSRGININRNYDTPGWAGSDNNYGDDATFGEYPGSEVETQHIMNTMHQCKAKVGLSMHGMGLGQSKKVPTEYTEGLMWQGCGFDKARMTKVAEALFSDYGQLIIGHTSWDQSYEYCGKSPAYIQYVGAVGGLNEIPDIETGTLDLYTPTVMEASYTQMLLFLQTWIEEALEKMGQ